MTLFDPKFFWTWIFLNQIFLDLTFKKNKKTLMTTTTTTIKMGFDTIEINLVFIVVGKSSSKIGHDLSQKMDNQPKNFIYLIR